MGGRKRDGSRHSKRLQDIDRGRQKRREEDMKGQK